MMWMTFGKVVDEVDYNEVFQLDKTQVYFFSCLKLLALETTLSQIVLFYEPPYPSYLQLSDPPYLKT
jgi:hypothetical protein